MHNAVTYLLIITFAVFKISTTFPQHHSRVTNFQDEANDGRHIFVWLPSDNTNIEEDLLNNQSEKSSSAGLGKTNDGSWNDVKRQVADFTPRLGRRWNEELTNSLENAEKNNLSKKLGTLFIPRLGKDLSLFQPRLG